MQMNCSLMGREFGIYRKRFVIIKGDGKVLNAKPQRHKGDNIEGLNNHEMTYRPF
jgi:hypothetical protein